MTTPPNVVIVRKRSGAEFLYYRAKGHALTPLPNLPYDDPAFLAAYQKAREAVAAGRTKAMDRRAGPKRGSLAALIVRAKRSDYFDTLSAPYRAMLVRHFDALRETYGEAPFTSIRTKHVQADLAKAENATDRLKAWRFLYAFALDEGEVSVDHSRLARVPRKQGRRKRGLGHRRVTRDQMQAFREAYPIGTVVRAGAEIYNWTGVRLEDGCRIGPGMVGRDGVLAVTQGKTKGEAYVPWTCPLPHYAQLYAEDRDLMHQAIAALDRRQMTFLATIHGRTRSAKAMGNMIREAFLAIGIRRSAHSFRKARACDLIDGGGTPHEAASWTGHEDLDELIDYAREANRRVLVIGTPETEQARNGANRGHAKVKTGRKAQ